MFNPREHLMDLKGKEYLQVMWRLVWFREEKLGWCIDTKLEQLTDNHAVFSAKIYDENGVLKSAGYGSEGVKDFKDFIEKAETKAVGRALAMLGYGTQFAPEMDEGDRIVDSPVAPTFKRADTIPEEQTHLCEDCTLPIRPFRKSDGTLISPAEWAANTKALYDRQLCRDCQKKAEEQRTGGKK